MRDQEGPLVPDWAIGILGSLLPLILLNVFAILLAWRDHRKILRESEELVKDLLGERD